MDNITKLLNEKHSIENKLATLLYGSVQIREDGLKKYIYVHYRDSGILRSKYAGEYSSELHNLIIENTSLAKDLKKRIKEINKQLNAIGYVDNENPDLSENVKINISIARRNLVDSIYKQSVLEGIATTYSDTETLINEGFVKNMKTDDVQKILNLKHAWEFILDVDTILYPTNYALLCQINELVETNLSPLPGRLRATPVSIGGSTYIPPIPIESFVKERLDDLLHENIDIDTGIELVLYIMKSQAFLDGNKRTAIIFANHFLIRNGLGLIVIPAELVDDYKKLLVNYYEDKDLISIKHFLKEKCWVKIK